MPITKLTLVKWRQEALLNIYPTGPEVANTINALNDRILRLTQELLDAYLIRKIRR